MQIKPLYRDPITGNILEGQSSDTLNTAVEAIFNEYVTLFDDSIVLTCCALVGYTAIPINSVNLPNSLLRNAPYVDCIILENGLLGHTVLAALTHGKKYQISTSIIYSTSDTLYLGRDGKVTTTSPSLINGDRWLVELGRLINHNEFVFDPQPPIDLNSTGGYTGDIPSLPGYPNTWLFNDGNGLSWKKIKQSDIAATPAVTSFNATSSSFEVGQQTNSPSFIATYNDTIISGRLKDNVNSIWTNLSNFTSFSSGYNFRLNSPGSISFLLEASTLTDNLNSSTNISWYYRRYYGTSSNLVDITNLQNNGLSSGRAFSFTANANPGEYIYISIPTSFGTPIFYVGGFEGGFHLVNTFNFTNSFGIIINYSTYQSDNHSLGNTTVTIS